METKIYFGKDYPFVNQTKIKSTTLISNKLIFEKVEVITNCHSTNKWSTEKKMYMPTVVYYFNPLN